MNKIKFQKLIYGGTVILLLLIIVILISKNSQLRKQNNNTSKVTPAITQAAATLTPVPSDEISEPISTNEGVTAIPTVSDSITLAVTKVPEQTPLTLEITETNSWDSNGSHFVQYDFVLLNHSQQDVPDWSLCIPVSKEAAISQSWNATYQLSNKILFITPDHNLPSLTGNGTCTFGLILSDAGVLDADKATIQTSMNSTTSDDTTTPAVTTNPRKEITLKPSGAVAPKPTSTAEKDVPEVTSDDWLYVKGNQIVDKNGTKVWLTGVNWFGYNTGTNTFDGLWAADLNTSLASIADHGFNLLRIPISTELILDWKNGEYPTANYNRSINSYLNDMNSLEIFDYVIEQCRANGLKIMIDIHCAKTDSMGHMYPVWYNGDITESDYNDALVWIAKRYKNDDTILAYDIKNEPHGKEFEDPKAIWNDSSSKNNWKYVAQKTAMNILEVNPNVLIMVEGIEIYPKDLKKNSSYTSTNSSDYYYNWWGGNLRGAKDYPIDLGKYQNKLVYSPHDYGPAVYQQPWFSSDYTYNSLMRECWHDNWFYLYEEKKAPLLIGEWGGYMTEPNLTWMTHLRTLIKKYQLHFTFWCFNANSGDTGGLVKDDFTTWDTEKYDFVKEVLWQNNGKFVGLDHSIPLGKNGISLSELK